MASRRFGDAPPCFARVISGFPSLARRLIDVRNQNWLPKIDSYLRGGQTYFVVVGAGHIGGPTGLLALLKTRGCKVEQL